MERLRCPANRPNAIFSMTPRMQKEFFKGYPLGSRFSFLCEFKQIFDFHEVRKHFAYELIRLGYKTEEIESILPNELKNLHNVLLDLACLGFVEKLSSNRYRIAERGFRILGEIKSSGKSETLRSAFLYEYRNFLSPIKDALSLPKFRERFATVARTSEWEKERTAVRKTEDFLSWLRYLEVVEIKSDKLRILPKRH